MCEAEPQQEVMTSTTQQSNMFESQNLYDSKTLAPAFDTHQKISGISNYDIKHQDSLC